MFEVFTFNGSIATNLWDHIKTAQDDELLVHLCGSCDTGRSVEQCASMTGIMEENGSERRKLAESGAQELRVEV